jgi:hypothetical protein
MLATLGTAAVLLVAALLCGQALCTLSGHRTWSWYAPAVGIALLTVVTDVAIRLPGRDGASAAVVAVLVAAAVFVLRRSLRRGPSADALAPLAIVFGLLMLPFLANGRFGVLGVSFNNDMQVHLLWAQGLASEAVADVWPVRTDYPVAPHALVATFSNITGAGVDAGFTAMLIAVGLAAPLAALSTLDEMPRARMGVAAALAGVPYLIAVYYGQSAFKETMQALFVLAFAVILRDVARRRPLGPLALVPLAVLCAAIVDTYSYPGLAWPFLTLAIWAVLTVVAGGVALRPRALAERARPLVVPVAAAAVIGLVALTPQAGRVARLFEDAQLSPAAGGVIPKSNIGNLSAPLSPYQSLGIWPTENFHTAPDAFDAGMLSAVALGVALFGGVWWLRGRDFALPAAGAAAALLYFYIDRNQSPYLSAKALVILAPLVALIGARALLDARRSPPLPAEATLARLAVALVFLGGAFYSSYVALRSAQVGASDHSSELGELEPMLRGSQTLFLGHDDFYRYELPTVPLSHPVRETKIPVPLRPEKDWDYGEPLDFDSVEPATLDRFRFVVTTRTAFASQPPPNFRPLRTTRSYVAWERTGPTPDRRILPEGRFPAAALDCGSAEGRRLRGERGTAGVIPKPALLDGLPTLRPGDSTSAVLRLRPGTWDVSLQYTSPQPISVSGLDRKVEMPPNMDRPGPYWHVGPVTLRRRGPVTLRLRMDRPSIFRPRTHLAQFGTLAAVRAVPPRPVPLREACGQNVDWYLLAGPRS